MGAAKSEQKNGAPSIGVREWYPATTWLTIVAGAKKSDGPRRGLSLIFAFLFIAGERNRRGRGQRSVV